MEQISFNLYLHCAFIFFLFVDISNITLWIFFFYHWSGKKSSKSIKTNQQKQNYQKHNCMFGLGDHCDGIVSSVQLGNASVPVKPASWLISPDYCLSILSALLTSPHTTPSPHHLPSLLTSLFSRSIHLLSPSVWSEGTV